MNKIMTKASLLAIALIVLIPLGLKAQDEGFYPYSFARLNFVNGSVYVQRASDQGFEKGEINLALVQGDKIGTEIGQAEIHFGHRNYLRLDNNTKVEFAVLPTEGEERIKIHLTEGSIYFRVSQLALDKGIEVHTPDASFYILEEGLYRFEVKPEGESQVFVREGSLEAAAEEGSVLVREKQTVSAVDGRLLNDPESDYARGDAFDEWNGSRDAQLSERSERQYLPSEMGDYEEELDQNGQWVYERPYGNVWVPNVSTYDDWRPYYYGRWVWYPIIGWTWVSSESWGWPVYHYGRWNWRFGLGWYWIPRSHWGPAWVHWWWDRDYVGWCPLTWYNRPGYLVDNRFYDRYDDRYFSAHNRAMTVVRRDHLQASDIRRHQIGRGELDRINRVELRAQQPSIRPAVDNARPQALAARRALADRPGGRNQVKSLAPSNSLAGPRAHQGGIGSGALTRGRASSLSNGNRDAIARPSIRGSESGSRTIRSYPSQRSSADRDQSGVSADRRNSVASPGRRAEGGTSDSAARVTRSSGQSYGGSRPATVRDPQGARSTGNGPGSSVSKRGEAVRTDPSSSRTGSTAKTDRTASTPRSVRSGSDRSSEAASGRFQSRTYASRSSVSRPSSRLSASSSPSYRSSASISRPSSSARSGSSGLSSNSSPRSSYASPSRSGSSSYSRPSSSRSASSAQPRSSYSSPSRSRGASSGRSYSAPRSSGSSSGRSYSAPRSSGSSSGRSYSAPRSGGSSSGRSSGSARSSSSGRSSSSSSKSSGSSSRSSGSRRK
jgi:hypothetical protein